MIIPSKFCGYGEGGRLTSTRRVHDGGGSSTPSTQTSVTDLPDWARPSAERTLRRAEALSEAPYQRYDQPRIAGFSPFQLRAQEQAAGMTVAPQIGEATDISRAAAARGLGAGYQAGEFGNQFQAPEQYQPSQFGMERVQAPGLQQYQMGPAERVGTGSFTDPGAASRYMSPYIEQALAPQLREAQRASDILGTQQAGQAVQQGAFGGSRAGLLEAERQRNLATQMGDIRARGMQNAYEQAQGLYGTEAQRGLQAQMANQQAGLTVGGQNLAAQLGVQQLGAGQNMQAQLANQQAYQNMLAQQEASRQFGYGQRMQAAGLGAQYGLAGQQLGEQSRQYGAGYGLQGLQTALSGAGQLGNLGQMQYGQQMGLNQLLNQYGGQQQALRQQGLSQTYQDFLDEKNYPTRQLGFLSDMIRGLPLGQQSTTQMYAAPASLMGQLGGLGMGAYGLSRMMAEGGSVEEYADGGSVDSPDNVANIVSKLSDQQLAQAEQAAKARGDYEQMQAIMVEKGMRASERSGLAGAFNSLPYKTQENVARGANGGIVAFAGGGSPEFGGDTVEGTSVNPLSFDFKKILDAPGRLVRGGKSIEEYYGEPAFKQPLPAPAPVSDRSFDKAEEKRLSQDRAPTTTAKTPKTPKTPKMEASISNAVTQMAKESGVPEESLRSIYDSYKKSLRDESAADMKDLMAMVEKSMGGSKEVKEQALGKALAEFGFKWAAAAAQPGAKFLGSAATAAPTIAASQAESAKLAREMDQNDMKLRMNLKQFEIAQRKGDLATAASLAAQERQLMQQGRQLELQRDQLAETRRSNIAREGIAAQKATAGGATLKAFMTGQTKALDRARNLAKDEWSDLTTRKNLAAKGITSYSQLYDYHKQRELKNAIPIYGVTPDDSDED